MTATNIDDTQLTNLRLMAWVDQSQSRVNYEEIRSIIKDGYGINLPDMRRRGEKLTKLTNLEPRFIDCCISSCMAFTGQYSELTNCKYCSKPRWRSKRQTMEDVAAKKAVEPDKSTPFRSFIYIPLIPRLRYQYQSPRRSYTLQTYCKTYFEHLLDEPFTAIDDWWAAKRYRDLRHQGLFTQPTDLAFAIHYDGVQAVQQTNFATAPVILINYNLPPATRYKKRNIILSLIIPGPNAQEDIDSFHFPLVKELKLLGSGVQVFDSFRQRDFMLQAWPVLAGGKNRVNWLTFHKQYMISSANTRR